MQILSHPPDTHECKRSVNHDLYSRNDLILRTSLISAFCVISARDDSHGREEH